MKLKFIKVNKEHLHYYFAVQNIKDYLLLISYCVNKKYPLKFIDPYCFRVGDINFCLGETKSTNVRCRLDEVLRFRFDNLHDYTTCSKELCYKMCIEGDSFISYATNAEFEYIVERKGEYDI